MEKRSDFYRALTNIAWGYVLLHLNINLGTLNILPNWGGYLLFLSALPVLATEEPSALLLRPFGWILALWEGLLWLTVLFGASVNLPIVEIIIGIVSLYFHFQLLTNLAELAFRHVPISEDTSLPLDRRLRRLRTVRTVLITILLLPLPRTLLEWAPFAVVLVLANLIVALRILFTLFELRRAFIPENGDTSLNS